MLAGILLPSCFKHQACRVGHSAMPLPDCHPHRLTMPSIYAPATAHASLSRPLHCRRSLGQNFMLDDDVLAAIVAAAGVQPGDLVLEIGPGGWQQQAWGVAGSEAGGLPCCPSHAACISGWLAVGCTGVEALPMHHLPPAVCFAFPLCAWAGTGNLTRHLLAAGALVTAVEKDYALSEQLEAEFEQVGAGLWQGRWSTAGGAGNSGGAGGWRAGGLGRGTGRVSFPVALH